MGEHAKWDSPRAATTRRPHGRATASRQCIESGMGSSPASHITLDHFMMLTNFIFDRSLPRSQTSELSTTCEREIGRKEIGFRKIPLCRPFSAGSTAISKMTVKTKVPPWHFILHSFSTTCIMGICWRRAFFGGEEERLEQGGGKPHLDILG